MNKNLYPELPEKAKKQAQELINKLKVDVKSQIEGLFDDLYCDITPHIEGDHWTNYQTSIVNGISDYSNYYGKEYNFKELRSLILKEHREEIIKDLNQDLLREIEGLKSEIQSIYERM